MSKREILAGATDQTVDIFIQDSSSTTGAGLAGLAFNTASLACYYRKGATGSATQLTLATQTVGGAHSDGGFVEIQATNMKGVYRLDLSDTIVASAGMVTIYLYGATNMAPCVLELEIVSVDKFNATNFGLSLVPANVTQLGGSAQSATDLKDFADDGYDPSTNKVQGVVLVDTLTTYTGNTVQTGDAYAIVNSGTHGNAALKTLIDAVDNFVDTEISDIQSRLPASLISGRMDSSVGAMAANVMTAAATAADYVTELQAGLSTLDAAGVRSAVGLASANLDTQLGLIYGVIDTEVGAIYSRIGAPAGASIAADIAAVKAETAAILDDTGTSGVVVAAASKTGYALVATGLDLCLIDGVAFRSAIQYVCASVIGKVSGAGTGTEIFKGLDGTTTRATVTVDSSGNRSNVVYVP